MMISCRRSFKLPVRELPRAGCKFNCRLTPDALAAPASRRILLPFLPHTYHLQHATPQTLNSTLLSPTLHRPIIPIFILTLSLFPSSTFFFNFCILCANKVRACVSFLVSQQFRGQVVGSESAGRKSAMPHKGFLKNTSDSKVRVRFMQSQIICKKIQMQIQNSALYSIYLFIKYLVSIFII